MVVSIRKKGFKSWVTRSYCRAWRNRIVYKILLNKLQCKKLQPFTSAMTLHIHKETQFNS